MIMAPKKKILYVITKSNWGGAQRYVYDLAVNLPKEQFEVVVAFGGTGKKNASSGLLTERLKENGIRTIFLLTFTRDIYFFREFKAFLELLKVIREEKPDVLHLNSSKAGGLGALAGRIAKVRNIIFTAHGFAHNEMRPFYQRGLIWVLSWFTILFAHTVVVLSHYELKHAPVIFSRRKLIAIHNGIDSKTQFESGEKIRSSFPLDAHITGTIGELTKNKNQIVLIEQANNDQKMYVAIVGEGEERVRLETKIKEYSLETRVKLFGFIPANEVLRGFDVFALPSIKEGLPYVLLEAKLIGLPIIANRVGGVGEILDTTEEFSIFRMISETEKIYNER